MWDPRVFLKGKGKAKSNGEGELRAELFNEPREKAVQIRVVGQKAPGGMSQETDYRIDRLLNACRSSERTFKTIRLWTYKRN